MAEFDKKTIDKTSSWFRNVAKSLGYAGYEVLEQQMPMVMNTFADNKGIVEEARQLMKGNKKSIRLSNIIGDTAAKNLESLKDLKGNAISDFKSGKFYNKERLDKAEDEYMFGDDDIFNFDDNYDDDSVDISYEEVDKDDPDSRPNITVNTNINEDNPMVSAIRGQSNIIIETTKQTNRQHAIISDLQMKTTSSFMQQLHGGLEIINQNVSQIIEFNSNTMSSFVGASLQFYESQTNLMGELVTEIKKMSTVNDKKDIKRYESPIDEVYGEKGGFSLSKYAQLVKKQFNTQLDNTMWGSSLKTVFDTPDAFFEFINNPLGSIPMFFINRLIPDVTKKMMDSFNKSFESFVPLFFDRIYELGDRIDDPMGIAKFIGGTLGIRTSVKTSIDSSAYEKGAVPFDGVTKKAIVNVIPTYLRKILAHLTGHDEIVFDSDRGKWTNLNTVKREYNERLNREATRGYTDIYDVKNEVDKLKLSSDQQKTFNESIENFFANLTRTNIGFNPLINDGSERDLIANLFRDNDGNTDTEMADTFRKIIKSMPKSTQMRIAREQLENRVSYTNFIKTLEANPDTISDLMNSGITDSKLFRTREQIIADEASNRATRRDSDKNANSIYDFSGYTQEQMNEYLQNANNIDEENNKKKKNRITRFFDDKFKGLTDVVNKVLIAGDKSLYRIIFGKETDDFADPNNESFVTALVTGIKQPFSKFFNWFEGGFNKISDSLIGDEGLITKLKETEEWKRIKAGAKRVGNYLFGEKGEDGKRSGGLFSDTANSLKETKDKVKDYFMGKDNPDSVVNNMKGMFGSFKTSMREFLFGEGTTTEDAKGKVKGVLSDFKDSLMDGFQSFGNMLFGVKRRNKDGSYESNVDIDQITEEIKKRAPKTLASGIIGGGIGILASAGGFGLLGSLFLGPMSGVVIGLGTGLLSQSERFKNFLFGERDEDTKERVGGFISKSTQNFFKTNKNLLIGGAALGGISGLLSGAGLLPSLVAGGPITGAIFGLGAAMLKRSETFMSFMFGDMDDDGKRKGGLITKITGTVNSDAAMKKLGHGAAGGILGAIGGATLSSFGLLGSLSIGPLGGAIVGAGAGIALAADKWKEKIFGKFDEDGNKTEAGLLSKLAVATSVNVLQPLRLKVLQWRFGVESWFEEKIAAPIMDSIEPVKEEFRRIGNKVLGVFESIGDALHIPDIVGGIKDYVFKPLATTIKNVGVKGIESIGKVTGWVIQKPVELVSMVVDKIIVPKHMREGLKNVRKLLIDHLKETKPVQIVTNAVTDIKDFTKGAITETFSFFKKVISTTFKVVGKTVAGVISAPFKAVGTVFEGIGAVSKLWKKRDKNFGDSADLQDIIAGNTGGFFSTLGVLGQTFNPFSKVRRAAKYQYIDEDALRERVIKDKFTNKETGEIIPHSEDELNAEVKKMARKYPGGAGYMEERQSKSKSYREKIAERRESRKQILDEFKTKVESNKNFAAIMSYNLLSDEDKEKISMKDLNKIEDAAYKRIYGKDYKSKTKIEQDEFKANNAARQATVNTSNTVSEIRDLLANKGILVRSEDEANAYDDVFRSTTRISEDHTDNLNNNTIGETATEQNNIRDIVADKGLLARFEDEAKDYDDVFSAMLGSDNRSEDKINYLKYGTHGVTAAEQVEENEKKEREEYERNINEKILGTLTRDADANESHAFNWGKIFGKTGLITTGILLALPFIIKFFKDPVGSLGGLLSGLGSSIVQGIREALGLDDSDGDNTNAEGDTQKNNDMSEAMTRGIVWTGKKSVEVGARGVTKVMQTADDIKKTGSKFKNSKIGKALFKSTKNVSDDVSEAAAKVAGEATDDTSNIKKFLQILKTVPKKLADAISSSPKLSKLAPKASKLITYLDDIFKALKVSTLGKYASKISAGLTRIGAAVIPFAGAIIDASFITYGIISGASKSETANLFHVSKENVTAGMRTVSAFLKGLSNYSWFFVFTLAADIAYELTGLDAAHGVATWIYKNLPTTDEEEIKDLNTAMSSFETDYQAYTLTEQIRKGNVQYDENGNVLKDADGNVVYKDGAEIESFDSYNDRENATMLSKLSGGVKKGWKSVKEYFTGRERDSAGLKDLSEQKKRLEEAHEAGLISEEVLNEQLYEIEKAQKELQGKEGLFSRIGTLFGKINTAGSKWWNDPVLDENGDPIIDEYTGNPVYTNGVHNFFSNTLGGIPSRLGKFGKLVTSSVSAWWNEPVRDEHNEPVIDEVTGNVVYTNKINDFLTNGLGRASHRLSEFGNKIVTGVKDWWHTEITDPDSGKKIEVNQIEKLVKTVYDNSLLKKTTKFFGNIYNSITDWWNTEIKDSDDEKFKISDIGKYSKKIFTKLTDKVKNFFEGLFDGLNDNDNNGSISFTLGRGGPTDESLGIGGPDVVTGAKKAEIQASNTNSAKYANKVKEIYGMYRQSSNYGWRSFNGGSWHNGIDLVKAKDSDVPAFTAGTVVKTTTDAPANSGGHPNYTQSSGKSYGNHVVIKDDRGNYNYYAHLNKVKVAPGQKVSVGQPVGLLGHTGHSTNAHLHYEVRNSTNKYGKGYSYDPYKYIFGTYSTSDVGNNYNYDGSSSIGLDGTSTGSTDMSAPAVDYLGLSTLASNMTSIIDTALSPLTSFSEQLSSFVGNYLGTNVSSSSGSSSTTSTDGSTINTSGGSLSSGNSGSADANAKRVYTFLKGYGIPDVNIAGVLGNWKKESGVDPTAVESIYNEPYTMGSRKTAAMANPGAFTQNLFAQYARQGLNINRSAYKGEDGIYYPGIGLGGFTGPAATKLIRFAKAHGKNWYDLEPQLKFATVPVSEGGYRNFMSGWKTSEASPAQAARRFLKDWEGINPNIGWVKLGERQQNAQYYFNKMKEWGADQSNGVGGPDETDVKGLIVDGNGDGKTPIQYELNNNFKKILDKYKGLKEAMDDDPRYSFDNDFKTMTYNPIGNIPKNASELPVGGPDNELELPEKIYEFLEQMVTHLSNIAQSTASTNTNISKLKTTNTTINNNKTSSIRTTGAEGMSNSSMLDIANKQKVNKSNTAYQNARLIASGIQQ